MIFFLTYLCIVFFYAFIIFMENSYPLDKAIIELHYSDLPDKISFIYQRFVPTVPIIGDTVIHGEAEYKVKEIKHRYENRKDGGGSHIITIFCEFNTLLKQ